jgi:beta-phosphoglucomutase-like phosphatase (HAD superfamily)
LRWDDSGDEEDEEDELELTIVDEGLEEVTVIPDAADFVEEVSLSMAACASSTRSIVLFSRVAAAGMLLCIR